MSYTPTDAEKMAVDGKLAYVCEASYACGDFRDGDGQEYDVLAEHQGDTIAHFMDWYFEQIAAAEARGRASALERALSEASFLHDLVVKQ